MHRISAIIQAGLVGLAIVGAAAILGVGVRVFCIASGVC